MTTDVCQQNVPEEYQNYKSPSYSLQVPDTNEIAKAIELWQKARKPVIWAGGGVLASSGSIPLKELAELTATPVFAQCQVNLHLMKDIHLRLVQGVVLPQRWRISG